MDAHVEASDLAGVRLSSYARERGLAVQALYQACRRMRDEAARKRAEPSPEPASPFMEVKVGTASVEPGPGGDHDARCAEVSASAQRGDRRAAGRDDGRVGEDGMFRFDEDLKVYLNRDAVDFRKRINGLSALVAQSMKLDRFDRAGYGFRNRRADRIKRLL
ncbi:MAG: IS66 family insertion sequence element accessory protein TnpB [Burkholderia sp.]